IAASCSPRRSSCSTLVTQNAKSFGGSGDRCWCCTRKWWVWWNTTDGGTPRRCSTSSARSRAPRPVSLVSVRRVQKWKGEGTAAGTGDSERDGGAVEIGAGALQEIEEGARPPAEVVRGHAAYQGAHAARAFDLRHCERDFHPLTDRFGIVRVHRHRLEQLLRRARELPQNPH